MKMNYRFNYWACAFSVLAALYCALAGSWKLAALNYFFAVYNWFIAGWLKDKQEKHEEDKDDSED